MLLCLALPPNVEQLVNNIDSEWITQTLMEAYSEMSVDINNILPFVAWFSSSVIKALF